jgi:hypothetical protein
VFNIHLKINVVFAGASLSSLILLFSPLLSTVSASDLDSIIDNFTKDLESDIYDSISDSLNNTSDTISTQAQTTDVFNKNGNDAFSSQIITTTGGSNDDSNGGISIGAVASANINSNGGCNNIIIGGYFVFEWKL